LLKTRAVLPIMTCYHRWSVRLYVCMSVFQSISMSICIAPNRQKSPEVLTAKQMSFDLFVTHSCTLLKPVDGMRCHLAGTLMTSHVTLYQPFLWEGRFGGQNPQFAAMPLNAKLLWLLLLLLLLWLMSRLHIFSWMFNAACYSFTTCWLWSMPHKFLSWLHHIVTYFWNPFTDALSST